MSFVALDVETANADLSSICQIGLARYEDRRLESSWRSLINPEDEFDPINIAIHGITEEAVKNAPTIPEVANELQRQIASEVVVCHTHFDRVAVSQAFLRYRLDTPDWRWLDTAKVARRTWEQFAERGYGLGSICEYLGHDFRHHDALEDAKACACIMIAAMEKTGLGIPEWLKRVEQPIGMSSQGVPGSVARVGRPDGVLHGEVMVFTGSLGLPRRQAADLAAGVGCDVADSVTKNTTILVVGDQDVRKLAGREKSSKHRKAESLIMAGQGIRILRETDFLALIKLGA